ncbi:hypothetical protein KVT40_002167 [Elsinoe batatas]|uniref:Rhodopsin domain-containing protein n=1 Tax=Elsinoe batatas TaxID=2601811 RepID=A0A8K0LE52_9PEZI|nr:hypothetical protein KVT40_002167 [Elsinoe batatas]
MGSRDTLVAYFDSNDLDTEFDRVRDLTVLMFTLTLLSTLLRFLSRKIQDIDFYFADDWWTILSQLAAIAQYTTIILTFSAGRQFFRGESPDETNYVRLARTSGGMYYIGVSITSIMLAFFCRRVWHMVYPRYARFSIAISIVHLGLGFTGSLLIQCTCAILKQPVTSVVQCHPQLWLNWIAYIFSGITVLVYLSYSIPLIVVLARSQQNLLSKIQIGPILLVGYVAPVSSILRLCALVKPVREKDYSNNVFDIVRWSILEVSMIILSINLSTLQPLFREVVRLICGKTSEKSSEKVGYNIN